MDRREAERVAATVAARGAAKARAAAREVAEMEREARVGGEAGPTCAHQTQEAVRSVVVVWAAAAARAAAGSAEMARAADSAEAARAADAAVIVAVAVPAVVTVPVTRVERREGSLKEEVARVAAARAAVKAAGRVVVKMERQATAGGEADAHQAQAVRSAVVLRAVALAVEAVASAVEGWAAGDGWMNWPGGQVWDAAVSGSGSSRWCTRSQGTSGLRRRWRWTLRH